MAVIIRKKRPAGRINRTCPPGRMARENRQSGGQLGNLLFSRRQRGSAIGVAHIQTFGVDKKSRHQCR